jgi:hypothetical protein
MKRRNRFLVFASVFVLFFSATAWAVVMWKTENRATVSWDAVTTLVQEDGTTIPLPEGDEIRYQVYLANAKTDPNKTNPALITPEAITTPQHTFTLGVEGSFFVGVKSIQYTSVEGTMAPVAESPIAWSDNPEDSDNGKTFGIRYFLRSG